MAAGQHVNSWILSRKADVRLTAASEGFMSCDMFWTTDVFNPLKFNTGRNILLENKSEGGWDLLKGQYVDSEKKK